MTSSFHGVALCSRCFVGPSDIDSLITWVGCSKNVPCVGYVDPFVVIESWLLLAYSCVGSTFSLDECEAQPWPVCELLCRCWPHVQNSSQQGLVSPKISLWVCQRISLDPALVLFVAGYGVCLFGASGRNFCADQCPTLPVTGPGQPVWRYKVIHNCGCLCWDWVCMGRTKPCTKTGYHQHWAWGAG